MMKIVAHLDCQEEDVGSVVVARLSVKEIERIGSIGVSELVRQSLVDHGRGPVQHVWEILPADHMHDGEYKL